SARPSVEAALSPPPSGGAHPRPPLAAAITTAARPAADDLELDQILEPLRHRPIYGGDAQSDARHPVSETTGAPAHLPPDQHLGGTRAVLDRATARAGGARAPVVNDVTPNRSDVSGCR